MNHEFIHSYLRMDEFVVHRYKRISTLTVTSHINHSIDVVGKYVSPILYACFSSMIVQRHEIITVTATSAVNHLKSSSSVIFFMTVIGIYLNVKFQNVNKHCT